jgi:glycosyltransferase involved in cell wall biosynthesis
MKGGVMRIAYVNTYFQSKHTGGGHVHMGQFVNNALAMGHEIWTYPYFKYPGVKTIPTTRLSHIKTMRQMDVLYIRLENGSPKICTWSLPPKRLLYGFPVVVWEMNTIPNEALTTSDLNSNVATASHILRRYGRGCDLAVCVSPALVKIAQEILGIKRVLVVPNGSDPEMFRPDAPIANRMLPFQDKFNVVWIGTGKEKWHDIKMLGEAARLVSNADLGKNIIFHLIGPDLDGIMADMPANVYYWGAEYYEKLPNWLAGMDVGLNLYRPGPADYGSPLKLFDYMASGLLLIGTKHPVVNDIYNQLGQSDLALISGDSKRLADVLVTVASDLERVRRLGLAGRQLVIDHYNWKRAVQDTMKEMEAILRERRWENLK